MNIYSKFVLKNQINKDGTRAILFRITCERKVFYHNTGIRIHENFWSDKKQKVSEKLAYGSMYNIQLDCIFKKLNEFITLKKINNQSFTLEDIKSIYKYAPAPMGENFIDFCTRMLDNEGKKNLKPSTYKCHQVCLRHLSEFAPLLTFNQITRDFLISYEAHCRTFYKNSTNGLHNKIKFIRTYMNKAIRDGIYNDYVFKTYHLKTEETKPKFLSIDDFNKLEEFYSKTKKTLFKKHLQYFLFACVTGLRYSDLKSLRWENIKDNWLMFRSEKTNKYVSVPITEKVRKYLPIKSSNTKDEDLIFKVPANQVANRILRNIKESSKISGHISTHVARHTFATICLNLDMPLAVVQKLLGHASIKTTEIYAKIIDKKLESEMKKWDK